MPYFGIYYICTGWSRRTDCKICRVKPPMAADHVGAAAAVFYVGENKKACPSRGNCLEASNFMQRGAVTERRNQKRLQRKGCCRGAKIKKAAM